MFMAFLELARKKKTTKFLVILELWCILIELYTLNVSILGSTRSLAEFNSTAEANSPVLPDFPVSSTSDPPIAFFIFPVHGNRATVNVIWIRIVFQMLAASVYSTTLWLEEEVDRSLEEPVSSCKTLGVLYPFYTSLACSFLCGGYIIYYWQCDTNFEIFCTVRWQMSIPQVYELLFLIVSSVRFMCSVSTRVRTPRLNIDWSLMYK